MAALGHGNVTRWWPAARRDAAGGGGYLTGKADVTHPYGRALCEAACEGGEP